MKMRKIREWKFREVLVEKGRKNGMGKMVEKLGFYRLRRKIALRPYTGAARFCRNREFSHAKTCFLEKCLSSLNF